MSTIRKNNNYKHKDSILLRESDIMVKNCPKKNPILDFTAKFPKFMIND